ncbi:probable metal-nicotianamine transporter YSL6 [Olea europaea var. sylvestris]|uniref:probable metal-nicotianamine transporter YSL6 n=1 Tax=Olea europaea var. sylvestris TaxID=158386 RepID=UPI000C1CF8AC|nr:probable metal-nicotianamine transporter YSL6 [Olea europaea var. sylvestris]
MATEQAAGVEISEPFLLDSEAERKTRVVDADENEEEVVEIIPEWKEQITIRGLVVSALLGALFCIITHKLNLTVGIIPSLNVAAGLLGFFFVKSWTGFLSKLGFHVKPFTRQENTVIQTCVVACYGLAFSGGFGSYLLSMDEKTYKLIGEDYPGNRAEDVKNPGLLWMMGFIFVVSFLGLFSLVPLRKVMVLDYKLTYPSGTATAMLINSFHTNTGAELARYSKIGAYVRETNECKTAPPCLPSLNKRGCVGSLFLHWGSWELMHRQVFTRSYFMGMVNSSNVTRAVLQPPIFQKNTIPPIFIFKKWGPNGGYVFNSFSINCTFILTPSFSYIYLDFLVYISSFMLTSLFSVFCPFCHNGASLFYYLSFFFLQVFIAISLILGDGIYNLIKIIAITIMEMCRSSTKHHNIPVVNEVADSDKSKLLVEQRKRYAVFLKDGIPFWFAASGYVALAAISTATMPMIFPPLKWYLVLCSYIIAPALAFCNSYGTGLTDWSLASTYGKIGLFIIASLVGSNGGVLAGLAACGVMMSIVSTAADLMQDFKTGYLTLSSAKSMFVSQLVGTAMGCVIAPLTFWMYWSAFDIGTPDSPYKAPYAVIYREMAILGVEGFSELPKHCLAICSGFFIAALAINLLRDITPKKVSQFIPIPMAMAVPFYIGAYFAIDMFVGTVILFVWERINRKDAEDYAGAVASGLICGDGIWTIPSAILSIFRINPPICMDFKPTSSG